MQKTVYKVVRRADGGRRFSVATHEPEWRVEYSPHFPARPHYKKSRLYAFDNYKDAVSFALFMGGVGLEIWLAEADVVEQKARAGFFQGWDYLYRVFWEHYDEKIGEPAPRGTVLCSTITIKERLAETVESSDGLITLQEMEPSR